MELSCCRERTARATAEARSKTTKRILVLSVEAREALRRALRRLSSTSTALLTAARMPSMRAFLSRMTAVVRASSTWPLRL